MTAQDYPVTFGYGQWDGEYYTQSRPHRGNDRPTPSGTPVVIAGKQIGLTGATGLVSGPHIHLQAGTDIACQNTFNPTPLEFKPGTVVATGRGSQWGNYVTVKVGGQYITYCHLNRIDVSVGQVLNEVDMPDILNTQDGRILAHGILGVNGVTNSKDALKGDDDASIATVLANRPLNKDLLYSLLNSDQAVKYRADLAKLKDNEKTIAARDQEIADLKAALGKKSDTDPNSIVVTQKGWTALFDAVKSFFNKNN